MEIQDNRIEPQLRNMQIVTVGIIAGLAVFFGVALLFHAQVAADKLEILEEIPLISVLSLAMLLLNLPMAQFVAKAQTQGVMKQIPEDATDEEVNQKLLMSRQTGLIVSLAMLEGPGFLGCIGILLEGHWLGIVTVIVAFVLMLAMFPTKGRLRSWLERQRNRLREIREFGSPS